MKFFLLAAACLALVCLAESDFSDFKVQYKKEYPNEAEELRRMKIYEENKKIVEEHNERYEKGEVTFKMKLNHLADLDQKDYMTKLLGFNRSLTDTDKVAVGINYQHDGKAVIPKEVDWRQNGAVTRIKDQGLCGSCWAFSSIGSLEGHSFVKNGKLVALSEQNLVDCSKKYGNNGCNGGTITNTFNYIKENGGVDTEESYRYEGKEAECRFDKSSVGAAIEGWVNLPKGDEHVLKEAVATHGPVSVAIDASHSSFQHYEKDVYYEPKCSAERLDHGVVVVGYGEENGKKYWLVKNSWSEIWGNKGYIKMARDRNNNCGIASEASYPIIKVRGAEE